MGVSTPTVKTNSELTIPRGGHEEDGHVLGRATLVLGGEDPPRDEVLEPSTPAALWVVAVRRPMMSCSKVAAPGGVGRPGLVLCCGDPVGVGVLGADDPRRGEPGGRQGEEGFVLYPATLVLGDEDLHEEVFWRRSSSSG